MALLCASRQAHEVGKHFTIVSIEDWYERQQTLKEKITVQQFMLEAP